MPIIKPKHVVSFSSEDLKHPAENLLKPETYFKWRSASGGERQVSAVLQLEKASKIQGIDIGNNGSAFIEVLVGRSSWGPNEEFQVLLVSSSFMTPAESKSAKELCRVRMFGKEHFTKSVCEEKWDLVKIVCTQPYNLIEPYGISFINIHAPPEPAHEEKKVIKLGRFNLKSQSDDDEDSITTGSFFKRQLPSEQNSVKIRASSKPKTMAAAVRDASLSISIGEGTPIKTKGESTGIPTSAKKASVSEDRREDVAAALVRNNTNKTNNSTHKASIIRDAAKADNKSVFPKEKTTEKAKRKKDTESSTSKSTTKEDLPPTKKLKTQKNLSSPPPAKGKKLRKKISKQTVPYNEILSGVVFGISGYENPHRGQIRDLALSMGAEYSPQWNSRCTHLICAFINTPKFQQVKGRGKIVKKDWIKECDKSKQRLHTKRFRLEGGGDSTDEGSETESEEEPSTNSNTNREGKSQTTGNNTKESKSDSEIKDVAMNDVTNQEKESHEREDSHTRAKSSSSECDTEDELEKIKQQSDNSSSTTMKTTSKDTSLKDEKYDGTTDEEIDKEETKASNTSASLKDSASGLTSPPIPELPDFFDEKLFLIYGNMPEKERRLMKRYVTAYSGTLVDYMSEKVNFVISNEDWDNNFDDAQKENESLLFIRPDWVIKCHEEQKLVDYSTFEIKSNS